MSLADIREQIKVILSGVSGIGVVHDYERRTNDWGKFLDLYRVEGTGKINGWTISRKATPKRLFAKGGSVATRTHHIRIRGIYGLKDDDASELIFQDLIEAIVPAFAAHDSLNSTCFTCSPTDNASEGVDGIQVDLVENRIFGNVLCHYAELSLFVQESF